MKINADQLVEDTYEEALTEAKKAYYEASFGKTNEGCFTERT